MWIQETTEQDVASPSGVWATRPPLHRGDLDEGRPHERISINTDKSSMNCINWELTFIHYMRSPIYIQRYRDEYMFIEAQQWKLPFIPTSTKLWNMLVLAVSQRTDVLCNSLNTSGPPLAMSIFPCSEGLYEKGTFALLIVLSLDTSKVSTMLQDDGFCSHNCIGHYSSGDSRGGTGWSSAFLFCNLENVFFCSCLLGVQSSGSLDHSRCIIVSNQAILQSVLPSGRMALWLLRCLQRAATREMRGCFFKTLQTSITVWDWGPEREGSCRMIRLPIQSNYSNVVIDISGVHSVDFLYCI